MHSYRIIFVDDETSILEGLRRLLHPMRKEWTMHFAEGGAQALEAMGQHKFDVVVTDMRMPEMDGAQLLAEIAERHPEAVRIALSGQSDEETLLRSVGPTHQYLSKPCSSEVLRDAIQRSCTLRDTIRNDAVRVLTTRLRFLPSAPVACTLLEQEMHSPDASAHSVGAIIETDVAMTAKLLQVANWALFGAPRRITSAAEAATCIGLEVIRDLATSGEVFSEYDGPEIRGFSMEKLRESSLASASAAEAIATAEGLSDTERDDAVVASLLLEIGTLSLATDMPAQYEAALQRADRQGTEVVSEERGIFGATHAEVGACIAGIWGLGDAVVDAIAHHHRPAESQSNSFDLATLVHVAEVLAQECPGGQRSVAGPSLDEDHLKRIGMADRLPYWRAACQETRAA